MGNSKYNGAYALNRVSLVEQLDKSTGDDACAVMVTHAQQRCCEITRRHILSRESGYSHLLVTANISFLNSPLCVTWESHKNSTTTTTTTKSFQLKLKLKGIVHTKMKSLPPFTHCHVVPNLYEFLFYVEHKRYFEKCW